MGLEWHNRPRSINGRFAKRAKALKDVAEIEIEQLHVRIRADLAAEVRRFALRDKMEISQWVEMAIEGLVEDALEDERQSNGQQQDDQTKTSG